LSHDHTTHSVFSPTFGYTHVNVVPVPGLITDVINATEQ